MKQTLLFIALSIPIMMSAQEVIATAGDYYESGSTSLSWSLGESIVETLENGSIHLTQGFQQSNLSVTTLVKAEFVKSLNVYPNPVADVLNIENGNPGIPFQLVDINGKIVEQGRFESESQTLEFSSLPNGTYILKLNNTETHKIIKQ